MKDSSSSMTSSFSWPAGAAGGAVLRGALPGRWPAGLPAPGALLVSRARSHRPAAADLDGEAEQLRSGKTERGELPRNFPRPYFTWGELETKLAALPSLRLSAWGDAAPLDFIAAPTYAGRLPLFLKKAVELLARRQRLIIVSHQASRLAELLEGEDTSPHPSRRSPGCPAPARGCWCRARCRRAGCWAARPASSPTPRYSASSSSSVS
jgi:hypothetical protein